MSENFITYKEKPLVRCKNEIYYGDMAEAFVVKFTILGEDENGDPNKIKVQLLKSDTALSDKDRIVKETTKSSMFEALDFGFVWLERALKS
ncbi:MAG: hypothetical protein IJD00_01755 [Clostridia bacterium]|nr:hypothetical protein [Clostridia bacterium]